MQGAWHDLMDRTPRRRSKVPVPILKSEAAGDVRGWVWRLYEDFAPGEAQSGPRIEQLHGRPVEARCLHVRMHEPVLMPMVAEIEIGLRVPDGAGRAGGRDGEGRSQPTRAPDIVGVQHRDVAGTRGRHRRVAVQAHIATVGLEHLAAIQHGARQRVGTIRDREQGGGDPARRRRLHGLHRALQRGPQQKPLPVRGEDDADVGRRVVHGAA